MVYEVPPDLAGQSRLYNHIDPLLRRLRVQDTTGKDIADIERYFKHKEVLVFYAGSEHGANNLREFHQDLTRFAIRELKSCSVIYVSTDTSPRALDSILSGQAWLRMTFHDNSDFAPMVSYADERAQAKEGKGKGKEKEVVMEEVARGEEFIAAGEIETGMEKVYFGEEENPHEYVRPLSRAAVTALMRAYATPSIAIYHLPTHQFIERNVKLKAFRPDVVDKKYHTWRNGGTESLRLIDILRSARIPILLLILALLYRLFLAVNEIRGNPVTDIIHKLSWRAWQR